MKEKSKLSLKGNSLFRFNNQFRECQQTASTIPTTTTITGTTTGITISRSDKSSFNQHGNFLKAEQEHKMELLK